MSNSYPYPSGPIPLSSPFYIERPPIEELAYQEIIKPGSLLRLKAPREMGKSSLMLRILDRANQLGYHTVSLDFQEVDEAKFTDLDQFLRYFAVRVSHSLNIEPNLDEYWDEDIGSKVSCSVYFRNYLLPSINRPLILALNEVNKIFEYPSLAREFLPLLRSWYETAKQTEIWQKIRLVVIYSTEVYVPFNLNQSPFNVGLPLKLPEFTPVQVEDLSQRYHLDQWTSHDTEKLINLVGGHPILVQLAFYHLASQEMSLDVLYQEAETAGGIYLHHLRHLLEILQADLGLVEAFKQVIMTDESLSLPSITAYKLESLGLIKINGCVQIRNHLYRQYFHRELLENSGANNWFQNVPILQEISAMKETILKLKKENQFLKRFLTEDVLTKLANRGSLDIYLREILNEESSSVSPLSLIFADIDFFSVYNRYCGKDKGDLCLQKIAYVLLEVVQRPSALIARYQNDEFVMILPLTDSETALNLAETIRNKVQSLEICHDTSKIGGLPTSFITLSLGVVHTSIQKNLYPTLLLNAAQDGVKCSQQNGGNRVTLINL